MKEKYADQLEWYIISAEEHMDGTPHLHLAICFKEMLRTRDSSVFDFITGKHGDYQLMRNQLKCVQYVTKGGVYVSENIDVQSVLMKKGTGSKFASVAKSIMEGKTVDEINSEDAGFFMMHKRKIEEYASFVSLRKQKEDKIPWVPFLEADIADMDAESDRKIATWLNLNIRKPRDLRQPQLYIHGDAQMGKTTMILNLAKSLSIFYIPADEDFYDFYEDDMYDLAVFDEFRHQKTMQWMNQWLDGQPFMIKKKGRQYNKKQNIPTIILSNYSLEDNYKKLHEANLLGPLLTRVEVVRVTSFISLWQ